MEANFHRQGLRYAGGVSMLEKVVEILSDITGMETKKIKKDSRLITDLELNSLDVVNMIVTFEENFDIEIPEQKIKDLVTVGDIVQYLESHV